MKRNILILGLFGTLSLVSCKREEILKLGVGSPSNEMSDVIVDMNAPDTKCEGSLGEEYLGESMVVTETGDTLYISVFLSDMVESEQIIETKSSLINSDNFGSAKEYTSFFATVYKGNESAIYNSINGKKEQTQMKDVEIYYDSSSNKWKFRNKYYWPLDDKNLHFCSFGPGSVFSGSSISNMSWNKDSKTFSFTYTTPSGSPDKKDAENQKDIIAGVNTQTHTTGGENSVNIGLKHPLMAVRFVMGDVFGKIEYISLSNFLSKGTANITSSGVTWSGQSEKKSFTQTFDMFDTTGYSDDDKASGTVSIDTTSLKTRNFIIIPQVVPDDASMELKMGNNLHPISLKFSKIYDDNKDDGTRTLTKDWTGYAGKILTFRVSSKKANLVSVTINDRVQGLVKDSIVIKNDGKSNIMIRVKLVGNWLNQQDQVLASWNETNPYGVFTSDNDNGFPTLTDASNWRLGADGFYYYKNYLESLDVVSENLFDSFTVTSKPIDATGTWKYGGADMEITTMELAILVQAVIKDDAIDPLKSFKAAWSPNNEVADIVTWIGTPVVDPK